MIYGDRVLGLETMTVLAVLNSFGISPLPIGSTSLQLTELYDEGMWEV